MNLSTLSLDITSLQQAYRHGLPVRDLIHEVQRRSAHDTHHAFIHRLTADELAPYLDALESSSVDQLPLYGVPFVVKDNIDVAGIPTTAGCPAFAYTPSQHALVVQRLVDAGAIPVAKANLDQFATGLNGTRSPYGACRNAFNPAFISGGSSSGSAVSVALGWASFSLGTDTAGSGRVPAAFNNLIGLKPTCGWLSGTGMVPACRSIDTVSIFALTAADAYRVLQQTAAHDPSDPFSRPRTSIGFGDLPLPRRVGIPRADQCTFFGNTAAQQAFADTVSRCHDLGIDCVEIDFEPFLEAARLLYEGPFVAERLAAIEPFISEQPEAVIEPVRGIIRGGHQYSAADAYRALYRLKALKATCDRVWRTIDAMLTPTAGTIFTIDEMGQDPVTRNAQLGYYTNFMNLLDYSAVAVPAGVLADGPARGLPFGVTLSGPAGQDAPLLRWADRLHRASGMGPGRWWQSPLPESDWGLQANASRDSHGDTVELAVCGAHLSGLPLNHQLTSRGARLVGTVQSAPVYRFYALPGAGVARPGMVRVADGGQSIDMEVWAMPVASLGSFVAGIPAPLGIGKVQVADQRWVCGFVCEAAGIDSGAIDITSFGSWRRYLASLPH